MIPLPRWSENLTIRKKFQALGIGLTVPFVLLLILALFNYQSSASEMAKTLELGRKGDEALVNGSKIDLLLLAQNSLQNLSSQAADPPGGVADPAVFEEARGWFDKAEGEWPALETSAPGSVRPVWDQYRVGFLETLPRLLADRLATRQRYDEAFQRLEGLTGYYQGRLTALAPPGVLLAQTQTLYAVLAVLQGRQKSYLDGNQVSEWVHRREDWKAQLPNGGAYRTLALEFLAVMDAELVPTLEAWAGERARVDLEFLKYHHEQRGRSQAMATHFVEEKQRYLQTIREGLVERTASQASLRVQSLVWLVGLLVLGLGGSLLLLWLLVLFERGLVLPLTQATQWATRIRQGDYGAQLPLKGNTELGILSTTLEHMVQEVLQKTREAETLNRNLEATVQQRTEHLAQALESLEAAQVRLVSSEKLAVLGTLAAGMAHELNTPLAAVISADRSILNFFQTKVTPARVFYDQLTGDERVLLETLTALASAPGANQPPKRTRAERHRLTAQLEGWGAPDAPTQAQAWIDLGLEGQEDLQRRWATHPRILPLLDLVQDLATVSQMAQVVLQAAEQAAVVVQSLKQYIAKGPQEGVSGFPLKASLETVLALIGPRRLKEVEIRWQIEPDLRVWGPVGALNQVWINLITNAVQAMEYRGQLSLEARSTTDAWVVGVRDSGPGIPPEVGNRIFEPFYTSKKDQGGMGLGLDICRRLVEAMGGTLTFQSQPGDTVFEVSWPFPRSFPPPEPGLTP